VNSVYEVVDFCLPENTSHIHYEDKFGMLGETTIV
jgi:hypothetical protein